MLFRSLQTKGYRVLWSNTGQNGIEMARRNKPDLIVLDLILSGVNGFDVVDQLHDDNATRDVPILILTAMDLSTGNRTRLTEKVWRIAEKGSLSTQNFINLVESAIASRAHQQQPELPNSKNSPMVVEPGVLQ